MMGHTGTTQHDMERRYQSNTDLCFASILREYKSAQADDDVLAELIEADGRARIALGMAVSLERYLGAVPDLRQRAVPLDAAIDVTLRGASSSSVVSEAAVASLIQRHPDLEGPIREAAALAEAIWSTTNLRERLELRARALPCDFGPRTEAGLPRFELRRLLGAGASGQVYLAVDRQLSDEGHEALAAIKILTRTERDPWARQRLIDEAAKARRVDHPNVIRVLDRGVSGEDEDYIVYDYVEAGDMAAWMAGRQAPVSAREAARLVAALARGVHAAHASGLVHCDLKPGNILMGPRDEPRVSDFGIAIRGGESQQTHAGDNGPIGNIAFISPEQFRGEPGCLTAASDIYALGGVLYWLLTDRLPNGQTEAEIAANHHPASGRDRSPSPREARPEIDADLDAVCRRAMALRPQERHASAAALAEDLEAWLGHEPIHWRKPDPVRRLRLWCRRRPAIAALAAIAALGVSGGLIASTYWSRIAEEKSIEALETQGRMDTAATLTDGLVRNLSRHKQTKMGHDALPTSVAWEWIHGDVIFGDPTAPLFDWEKRAEAARYMVDLRKRQGFESSFETLLWETTLGMMLINRGEHAEAEQVLRGNLERWRKVLRTGDDPWLVMVERMLAVSAVANLKAKDGPYTGADRKIMAVAESILSPAFEYDRAQADYGTVQLAVMNALAELYSPRMLDKPELHGEAVRRSVKPDLIGGLRKLKTEAP